MSDIASTGGERALILRLAAMAGSGAGVIRGIGDDCAVLPHDDGQVLLVTTDMLVEGRHFRRDWCTWRQIGLRAAEANLSDIAAMGGEPRWALAAVTLPGDTDADHAEELARAMVDALGAHGASLVGGDTCRGDALVVSVTLLGLAPADRVRGRGDARPGELLAVTGTLGKARAGLELLLAGQPDHPAVAGYLEPRCRLDLVPDLAPRARAMIDVSDGLASEVRHLCEQSGAGAEVRADAVPLSHDTREAAALLGQDPLDWALHGGEDYELLFSASAGELARLEQLDVTVIGEVLPADQGIWLRRGDRREALSGGFDHFEAGDAP